ncbi:hypothetical protein V8E53_000290 [Lactarius tabidus]
MAEIAAAEFSYRTQNGPGRAGDREIFQEYFSPLSAQSASSIHQRKRMLDLYREWMRASWLEYQGTMNFW